MAAKIPTAILISGRGSNMQALVGAARASDYPAAIVSVISNRPDAAGLDWARTQGIPASVVDHKHYASRSAFEADLQETLRTSGAEFVALAGFMRLMTPDFVARWHNRMINIHPSLLPSFKGLHTHDQALAAGVKVAGCSVHFVRAELDAGPIIAQAAVPVMSGDTPATLSARVLAAEHKLYPAALRLLASGALRIEGNNVLISKDILPHDALYSIGV